MPKQLHLGKSRQAVRRDSIREQLERQAWINYPRLARRLAQRRRRRRERQTEYSRIMRWQDRTLLALATILLVLLVVRAGTAQAEEPWGLHLQHDGGASLQLAIDTTVRADITGLLARVEVTQHFRNDSAQWAEAVYRFPLPQGAAVDRMRIQVGERVLEGEIQEKATARRVYQQALDSGQTASLVEQQRRNQFETRLANIAPGETVEVSIAYLQNVTYRDFSYHLRIPLTFTPRWTPPGDRTTSHGPDGAFPAQMAPADIDDHRFSMRATLVSPAELAAIESRYHDVDIRQVEDGYRIDLLHPDELGNRDFELSWTPALQTRPAASLTTYNDGESVYAQLMLMPPLAHAIMPQAREVILVIDTSGSMEGASLAQARAALLHALSSLGPDDFFNLLQFNSATEALFDHSVPVLPGNLEQARGFIDGLQANGGTDMAPALQTALQLPDIPGLMRQVVFITDGAVGNEAQLLRQVAVNLGESRMFTVAIGHAPNSWFMRKAAEIGRGSHVHIGEVTEVERQMSSLWQRIQTPALTDICVDWGEQAEYYPEIIPDLYAGEPLWLVARLPHEPDMIGLCGRFNDSDWRLDVDAWEVGTGASVSETLAILWARKKIEALEDGLVFGADRELTQLEITALALDFGLLTAHTSLVAVDRTPRRFDDEQLVRSEIPGLLPAGSVSGTAFPRTATGWLTRLLLSLYVLTLASSLLWFSGSRLPVVTSLAKS